MAFSEKLKKDFETDDNIHRARSYARRGARALPSATAEYIIEKAPIVQWLPRYAPKWLLNDAIAGLTIGVMMIPQSLAYAKIATIEGQFGLMSGWIPGMLYAIMGTSKDLSTGPTSIISLLTAGIIKDFTAEGVSPQVIASTVALMIGIYSMILGFFKLGFLLDFISVPVLTGFVSAAAIVILLGQVPSIFGEDAGTGTANIIHDIFAQLPQAQPLTIAIGFSGIILLFALEFVGKRWGKKHKIIWLLSISRAALALLIFTTISFIVNRNRADDPLFAISKIKADGISPPKPPSVALASRIATRAIAPFIAAALEHIAIGKAFGRKNDYDIDTSQELCYLGITNFLNSFFSGMGVGGAMSRTAVNSESGVKSPLSGLITAGFVILSIYELTGALFWIPKATLSAIIITAVWHIIGPASVFYRFYRTSFADFTASMLTFWITLFVSAEIGIGIGVAFSIAYTLLRTAFARIAPLAVNNEHSVGLAVSTSPHDDKTSLSALPWVPTDTQVFRFTQSIIFPNAYRVKGAIWDTVQVYSTSVDGSTSEDRNWSVAAARRLRKLRGSSGITTPLHDTRVIVLDCSNVTYIDMTGIIAIGDLKADLRKLAGETAEMRFVSLNEGVRRKMEKAGWKLVDKDTVMEEGGKGEVWITASAPRGSDVDVVYSGVREAVFASAGVGSEKRAREMGNVI
ncbi:MAG: hypothetical protein Q9160_005079 [Pyrenula sp. 1 TL-2023]